MSFSQIILTAILLGGMGVFILLWKRTNGFKSFQSTAQRSSDKRKLTHLELKQKEQAYALYKEGKVILAAQILEQLQMPREAINVLEETGHIHEAAKILKRMHKYDRAGVIYYRHGFWAEAVDCFQNANLPLETAKAAREGGNYPLAAQKFEQAGKLEDAAECYGQAKDYLKAAKLLNRLGFTERAMTYYRLVAENTVNKSALPFDDREIDQIIQYLANGRNDGNLADVLIQKNRVTHLLMALLKKGDIRIAKEIYLRAASDLGPVLISEVNLDDPSCLNYAELFLQVANFKYAGILFERLSLFDQAGDAFEKSEDFDRASYCYERAGSRVKSDEMKEKMRAFSKSNPKEAFAVTEELTQIVGQENEQAQESMKDPVEGNFNLSLVTTSTQQTEEAVAKSPKVYINTTVKMDEHKAAFMKAEFISDLTFEQRDKLWNLGASRAFDRESVVLNYRDEPEGIYTVVSGAASCYRRPFDREIYLDQMGASESFGELWLLADQPSEVKFIAAPGTVIHVIERGPFLDLLDRDGQIARKIYKRFTYRLLKRLIQPREEVAKVKAKAS